MIKASETETRILFMCIIYIYIERERETETYLQSYVSMYAIIPYYIYCINQYYIISVRQFLIACIAIVSPAPHALQRTFKSEQHKVSFLSACGKIGAHLSLVQNQSREEPLLAQKTVLASHQQTYRNRSLV